MPENKTIIGIDAGSVSVSMVRMDRLANLLAAEYVFHHGDIEGTIEKLAGKMDVHGGEVVVATGSTPSTVNSAYKVDNQIAVIEAVDFFHDNVRGVLLVGGEKFFLCRFDEGGRYLETVSNTSCAAGTGSFLDQQAVRLKMAGIEELSETAEKNSGACPRIASRCAVFAKTDLIHAQQEGYHYQEISDGLCRGLAKNIVDTLFAGNPVDGTVIFCGGVAKNPAVAAHIEELAGVSPVIPENGHLYGAIGAALAFFKEKPWGIGPIRSAGDIVIRKQHQKVYSYPPLRLELSSYPDFSAHTSYLFNEESNNPVEIDVYAPLGDMDVHLGLDIGSTSTKAVLTADHGGVVAGFYTRTAGRPLAAVQSIFAAIDDFSSVHKVKFQVASCATTGSGRKFIGVIVGADAVIDEITAHARAAVEIDPKVDTIIEIGGQDAKFTTLKNGRVTSSVMNTVCAAGTGSFIEEQAARLGCSVREYSARAENVAAPMASDRCTVFMERDINHHLNEGFTVDEVLASALHSVRENYLMKVATEKNIGDVIFFQGATAKNKALVAAFEQRLKKPILVSPLCHLTGAYGAALVAAEEGQGEKTRFKGIALHRADIQVATEICTLCNNSCKLSVADTPHGKVAYGFLCGRDYETQSFVAQKDTRKELLGRRASLLRKPRKKDVRKEVIIGLPAALHMVDELHVWQYFFTALSIPVVTSSLKGDYRSSGKNITQAEFCAPMTALHGHVESLLSKCDFIFLPSYLEKKTKGVRRQYCYYSQFATGVVATVSEKTRRRLLSPVIRYLYTSFHTKIQLYRMLQKVMKRPPGFLDVSQAYETALEYDREYRNTLKELYNSRKREDDQIDVVLLGRPYTILSPSMNCSIPSLFARIGVDAYFQDMVSYSEDDVKNIKQLLEEVHWQYAAKILEVAEVVGGTEGSYPVYVTSFKCSPDSFVVDYFKKIMEANKKPYLILELDEHDSSVGYETRIEAAVRSFRNHRQQNKMVQLPSYRGINPDFASAVTGKNIVLPNWDRITCALLTAVLKREGFKAYAMEENETTIRKSLRYNSGQCIPLNAIAEGFLHTMKLHGLNPEETLLWIGKATIACNIKLYPYHIQTILNGLGIGRAKVYVGGLSFAELSLRASMSAYFAYMFGGLLRKVACSIRPYEVEKGTTDRVLDESVVILCETFLGKQEREEALHGIIDRFAAIAVRREERKKVAVFGDLYSRDNRIMNQNLIRYIEENGGEVITTPYSEYLKMIAPAYFRKWFNEGKYFDILSSKATLAAMVRMEKKYARIFDRILGRTLYSYDDSPRKILARYNLSRESSGESMENLLKIHYLTKYHKDISLFVQASPALCCPSLVTEAMRKRIEEETGVPVVSVIYDGTGGEKNSVVLPYLKYGKRKVVSIMEEDYPLAAR